jgi:hypothetical protein
MKKVILTLAVVFGLATAASAQLVIGGNIGIDGSASTSYKDSDRGLYQKTPSSFALSVSPKIGFMMLDQRLEVGLGLAFTYYQTMNYIVQGTYAMNGTAIKYDTETGLPMFNKDAEAHKDYKAYNYEWSLNPYARFRLFNVKGFSMWLEGVLSFGTSIASTRKYYAYDKGYVYASYTDAFTGMTYASETEVPERKQKDIDDYEEGLPKTTHFNGSFAVRPVLTYDFNEHWRIETQLNLLSLYIGGYVETRTQKDVPNPSGTGTRDIKTTENHFTYGAVLQDKITGNSVTGLTVFDGVGFLTLGVAYKF